ncbi:DMT family transporter [Zoogloea sp. LCSB751]|uniref:DMT family transporter n=1 Tax=Zoogloea sp. LCSB751 TaxID=1965277 RepID=UPI0009A53CF0|nr:DMT family transporter [Zoogloea sp. LCSB751]
MPPIRIALLTTLAMLAFAANSILCRLALRDGHIDAASFTALRVCSGALILWALLRLRGGATGASHGNWPSALALFVYAAGFSFAYLSLSAATGALLLFGAVQATMIGYGLWHREHLGRLQTVGLALAAAGLVALVLPGLSAPPLGGSLLMALAGVAWGAYSLRGRGGRDPAASTAGNFARAAPLALALSAITLQQAQTDMAGIAYALASGGLASGIGYVIWYMAMPQLRAASAASVQLSVPVIAALGGVVFLGEAITPRLVYSSIAILGGIALVIAGRRR